MAKGHKDEPKFFGTMEVAPTGEATITVPETKEAATAQQVLSSLATMRPKMEALSKSVQAFLDYKNKAKEAISNVKIDLAKKLAEAADIYTVLIEECGEPKDFLLKDPQYGEAVETFGIRPAPAPIQPVISTNPKRGRASDTKEKILDYTAKKEEPVTVQELEEKLGVAALTVRNNIKSLIAEKKLKEQGKDGRQILYVIAK